jgi:hypothetical protein
MLRSIGVVCALALVSIAGAAQAQFSQQGPKLVGTGAVNTPYPAYQGWSVLVSGDGNTAIVGGYGDNGGAGAAWVYTRFGGLWSQQGAKLVGSDAVDPADQGYAVSISGDGNTAIVGGVGDNGDIGAAWVYARSGGLWSQQGPKLVGTGAVGHVQQGISVSLSGDGNTAIVGGYGSVGGAWMYTRSGGLWSQQGPILVGTGAVDPADQGYSVSISGDGNTAIVGGPGDNGVVGAAWVYTRLDGVWSQQGAKLVGTGAIGLPSQGYSVSISGDGNTAIVGGPGDNGAVGAAWVYTRLDGVWSQQGAKLVGTGAVGLPRQGYSVSISGDGNTAIVGGYVDNGQTGAAWVYTRLDGVWSQQGAKLVGAAAVDPADQGYSVSLSGDGNTAIVGGPGDNSGAGAAWAYTRPIELKFAGTPGKTNCYGSSVSALAREFGGLNNAAAALGYTSVEALQDAIRAFCGV